MKLTKEQLENKIEKVNKWLLRNPHLEGTLPYRGVLHKRNYYVNKLIELEEYGTI
jgi:hypothetical protein